MRRFWNYEPVWDKKKSNQPGPDDWQYAAGFLLAGGKSSRMGENKALLRLNGQTLIERAVLKLQEVCPDVAIAGGGPELKPYGRIVPDRYPGLGPLGGIVAALESSSYEWNLFLAVDMPHVPVSVLRTLLSGAGGRPLVVMCESAGQIQPLCAVYSRNALPVLRQELLAGRLRVRAAVEATQYFSRMLFEQAGPFANVNTPEDFAEAEKQLDAPDA